MRLKLIAINKASTLTGDLQIEKEVIDDEQKKDEEKRTMVEDKPDILKPEENPIKDEGENKQVWKIFRK